MLDFRGCDAGALWEDIKFDAPHFNDLEPSQSWVTEKWERGMAVFCKPFTTASVRYFDESNIDEAREWLAEE